MPCVHIFEEFCVKKSVPACKTGKNNCKICTNNTGLLKTGRICIPSIVFYFIDTWKLRVRPHIYGELGEMCKSVMGYDANSLYLYCCSRQEIPCKAELIIVD